MQYYFSESEEAKYRGRPITTLPVTLHGDLKRVGDKLSSERDLENLRKKATDRKQWKLYCTYVTQRLELRTK